MDPRPEAGGYGLFTLGGKNVAGLGPQMNAGMPPFWAVYVSVADAAQPRPRPPPRAAWWWPGPWTCSRPGSMAVLADSAGSFMSVWQAKRAHRCPAGERARHLHLVRAGQRRSGRGPDLLPGGVRLGARSRGQPARPAPSSRLTGRSCAEPTRPATGEFPAWSVWFSVEDCDASAAQVTELGGTVHHGAVRHGLRSRRGGGRPARRGVRHRDHERGDRRHGRLTVGLAQRRVRAAMAWALNSLRSICSGTMIS